MTDSSDLDIEPLTPQPPAPPRSKAEQFTDWVESNGADVETIQEDDSSGYTVLSVAIPSGAVFDVTVNELCRTSRYSGPRSVVRSGAVTSSGGGRTGWA